VHRLRTAVIPIPVQSPAQTTSVARVNLKRIVPKSSTLWGAQNRGKNANFRTESGDLIVFGVHGAATSRSFGRFDLGKRDVCVFVRRWVNPIGLPARSFASKRRPFAMASCPLTCRATRISTDPLDLADHPLLSSSQASTELQIKGVFRYPLSLFTDSYCTRFIGRVM